MLELELLERLELDELDMLELELLERLELDELDRLELLLDDTAMLVQI
jgi:hypothetical protein